MKLNIEISDATMSELMINRKIDESLETAAVRMLEEHTGTVAVPESPVTVKSAKRHGRFSMLRRTTTNLI